MIVFLKEETELGAMTDSDGGDIVSSEEDVFSSSWLASVIPTNFGQAFSRKSSKERDELDELELIHIFLLILCSSSYLK